MKKVITLFLLSLALSSFAQYVPLNRLPGQKGDWFDVNYTLSFKDYLGLKWTSKLGEVEDKFNLQGFNGQFFYNMDIGKSKLSVTYDTYKGLTAFDKLASKWGFSFINSGPNSNVSISLYNYSEFGQFRMNGIGGSIDIQQKFK